MTTASSSSTASWPNAGHRPTALARAGIGARSSRRRGGRQTASGGDYFRNFEPLWHPSRSAFLQPGVSLRPWIEERLMLAIAVVFGAQVSAQTPSQMDLAHDGGAAEFRDRMIYEAIAWRGMQVKRMSAEDAVQLRNRGREEGLHAFWEWKTPDVPEAEQARLLSCRKAAQGARYALNDHTELLLSPSRQWEENYRTSLSTYSREWPKCEQAFPQAVKAMKNAYHANKLLRR